MNMRRAIKLNSKNNINKLLRLNYVSIEIMKKRQISVVIHFFFILRYTFIETFIYNPMNLCQINS